MVLLSIPVLLSKSFVAYFAISGIFILIFFVGDLKTFLFILFIRITHFVSDGRRGGDTIGRITVLDGITWK